MAQFKEVTLAGGKEKITINLDEVRSMQRIQDSTTIRFDKEHVIHVNETPDDILMRQTLRNL